MRFSGDMITAVRVIPCIVAVDRSLVFSENPKPVLTLGPTVRFIVLWTRCTVQYKSYSLFHIVGSAFFLVYIKSGASARPNFWRLPQTSMF